MKNRVWRSHKLLFGLRSPRDERETVQCVSLVLERSSDSLGSPLLRSPQLAATAPTRCRRKRWAAPRRPAAWCDALLRAVSLLAQVLVIHTPWVAISAVSGVVLTQCA